MSGTSDKPPAESIRWRSAQSVHKPESDTPHNFCNDGHYLPVNYKKMPETKQYSTLSPAYTGSYKVP